MGLRNDRPEISVLINKALEIKRRLGKEPVVQLNGVKICEPVAVIAKIVALEPPLSALIEVKSVLRFPPLALVTPIAVERVGIKRKPTL
jgi:hypothetical protein